MERNKLNLKISYAMLVISGPYYYLFTTNFIFGFLMLCCSVIPFITMMIKSNEHAMFIKDIKGKGFLNRWYNAIDF